MGASLWDQVWLPLLLGLAIQLAVIFLGFLSVRLWNCFTRQLTPQTAVGASADDQSLPENEAAAHANSGPNLETGNGYGPAEGEDQDSGDKPGKERWSGQSIAETELELGIVEGGEGLDYFSDQEAHPPVFESPVTTPDAHVTGGAARGALACAAC